jgi:hypothetical protein
MFFHHFRDTTILLGGEGKVWVDGLQFEVVGEDVPTTGLRKKRPKQPLNLDFEGMSTHLTK